MIHPNFFTNDDLGGLPPLARLLFVGLWCLADREGRLEDRPVRIRLAVLPFDQKIDVDKLLGLLNGLGFILRYEIENRRFIQVANFKRFQRPHPNEAKSVIPAPASDNVISHSDNVISTRADSQAFELRNTDQTTLSASPNGSASGVEIAAAWAEAYNANRESDWSRMDYGGSKDHRHGRILARLKELPIERWPEVFKRTASWKWASSGDWRPGPTFFLRPGTWPRALEGEFGLPKSETREPIKPTDPFENLEKCEKPGGCGYAYERGTEHECEEGA